MTIKRFIPLDTVVDNYIDDNSTLEESEDYIERACKRAAYRLYSKSQAALYPLTITGKIKQNSIQLPEDFCNLGGLKVDNQRVNVPAMQSFLRGNVDKKEDGSMKARIVGDNIIFNVVGGTYGLDAKDYILDYETVPLINGVLFVPEQFEEAIHANLEYRAMKTKVQKNGRGEGLLRTFKASRNEAEIDAIADIEMPSFEQLLAIGKIWESKIPVSIQGGINNNFGKF